MYLIVMPLYFAVAASWCLWPIVEAKKCAKEVEFQRILNADVEDLAKEILAKDVHDQA